MSKELNEIIEKENLQLDRDSLRQFLKEVFLQTKIDSRINEEQYIQDYIKTHSDIRIEEMNKRVSQIEQLYHMSKNYNYVGGS